ncbi:MAG: outer membrane beta-barrel protein [Polaromonas sp.]|nr:outer membrane beta-barrel protein [Polaromonas sp.]
MQYSDLGKRDLVARNAAGAAILTGTYKASQYSVAGTGTVPLAGNFSLLGKLGVSSNRGKVSVVGQTDSSNKTSVMAGVGVAYNFTPALAVRVEYEDFGKFGDGFGGSVRANATTVSLKYAF